MPFLLIAIPILFFLITFKLERRSLWIGFFFILLTGYLLGLAFVYLDFYEQKITFTIAIVFILIITLLIPFYILSFIIALISSGVRLIKREGKKLHNFLSLFLGIFMVIWLIVRSLISIPEDWIFLQSLAFFISISIAYIILVMICFAISALFNRFNNPLKTYDYIIVLGSGLIDERIPPLLASRIDKGIEIFHRQREKGQEIKLVFTGGQGPDEKIAEGVAMAKYAVKKGIKKEHIIVEDQAVNTYENILFSKRLIDQDRGKHATEASIITVTNNFHIFRALLWTRKVGIKSDGAGSKTKFYFWLNALIREFIAVLAMERRFHITMLGLIFITSVSMYFITKFYVLPI